MCSRRTCCHPISIHAPARGATRSGTWDGCGWWNFNPRSREGSDIDVGDSEEISPNFNPRSREGSDFFCPLTSSGGLDFNPRSREGSDEDTDGNCQYLTISIHAPARGATCYTYKGWQAIPTFQSTLPRGERHLAQQSGNRAMRDFNPRSREGSDILGAASSGLQNNFNPRSREGSDAKLAVSYSRSDSISIHAPARGATAEIHGRGYHLRHFNPRSREGSDHIRSLFRILYKNFNPRSREGSDYNGAPRRSFRTHFNPRSREGSDGHTADDSKRPAWISIHAPARGATGADRQVLSLLGISIHAPARGATIIITFRKASMQFQSTLPRGERLLWACATRSSRAISIHAPARGATITPFHLGQTIRFQSTLPRGERPDRPSSLLSGRIFQSTLPRGERRQN